MKRFKVQYNSDEDGNLQEKFVVAKTKEKALKAFHIKVPNVESQDILSIDEPNDNESHAAVSMPSNSQSPSLSEDKDKAVLGWVGIASVLIGGFVLVNPTAGGESNVANFHMLTIGETLSIVGAIFIAMQWRPR
ncbi:hypothetical protein [Halomonas piscis]|uniref:hypothetical protein n=1 Tax=Halomonas piscis TaxID=3031727 RepID=UPI00289C1C9F|nr:hypothetical protein [Halomonas piscis]